MENADQVDSGATVINFMSVTRKLSSDELKDVTIFGDLCHAFLRCVSSYTHKSTEVHLILENYKVISPKSSERLRRATSVGIPCKVMTDDKPLPDLRQFYNLTDNKKGFQNFFVKYCIAHYKSTKPLYIAGGLTDDPDKCTVYSGGEAKEAVAYRASHEEADDRMMFSIIQLYKKYTINSPFIKDSLSITVVTPDTDIFVVLMYNLKDLGL